MALPFNLDTIQGFDLVRWLNNVSPSGMSSLNLSQEEMDSLITKVMQTAGPGDVSRLATKFGVDAGRISQATGIPAGTLQDVHRQIINTPTLDRNAGANQASLTQYTPENSNFFRPEGAPPIGLYRDPQGLDYYDPQRSGVTYNQAAGGFVPGSPEATSGYFNPLTGTFEMTKPTAAMRLQALKNAGYTGDLSSTNNVTTPGSTAGATAGTNTGAGTTTGGQGTSTTPTPNTTTGGGQGTANTSQFTNQLPTLGVGQDIYNRFTNAAGSPRALASQINQPEYSDIEGRLRDLYSNLPQENYSDLAARLQDIYGNLENIDITQDPSYRFRFEEGLRALERSAAARGGLFSGRTGRELSRYGQDLASTEYQNAYQRALQTAQQQAGGVLSEASLRQQQQQEGFQRAGLQGAGSLQEAALRQQAFTEQLQRIAAQEGLSQDEFNRLLASYNLGEQAFGQEFGRGFNLANLGFQAASQQLGGANVPIPNVNVAQGNQAQPGQYPGLQGGVNTSQTGFGLQNQAAQQLLQAGQLTAAGGLASGQVASNNIASLAQLASAAASAFAPKR